MNKYDSRLLKCLFLSTSPVASSRVCWACIIVSSVLKLCKCLTLFYMWVCHVLWALRLKSINQTKSNQTTPNILGIFWVIYGDFPNSFPKVCYPKAKLSFVRTFCFWTSTDQNCRQTCFFDSKELIKHNFNDETGMNEVCSIYSHILIIFQCWLHLNRLQPAMGFDGFAPVRKNLFLEFP